MNEQLDGIDFDPTWPFWKQIEFAVMWAASRLQVVNEAGDSVPFSPRPEQIAVYDAMREQAKRGQPVRIIVLKARQPGISTGVQVLLFALCYLLANRAGFVCAHDDESSWGIFRKAKSFEAQAPAQPTDYSSRKEIRWSAPHGSSIQVQTAGTLSLGRGETFQYLHCSELAFWSNASESALSLLQTVIDAPGTIIVIESTANGAGGEFYERWQAAQAGKGGYVPLFFPWTGIGKYSSAPTSALLNLDIEERDLRVAGVTDPQLAWRRFAITDKCGGDVERFHQEYPSNPAEAFVTSGRPAIPAAILREHQRTVQPGAGYDLFWLNPHRYDQVRVEEAIDGFGPATWRVYSSPLVGHHYAIGGDPAKGELADVSNPKSDPDWADALVIDRRSLAVVAELHCRLGGDLFGEQCLLAARWFGNAWLCLESNLEAALLWVKRTNYPNVYRRQPDELILSTDQCNSLGFETTVGTRDHLIDQWIAACRPLPDGTFLGRIFNRSQLLADQEASFQYDARGKRQHRPGTHDDMLFAAMLAYEGHCVSPLPTERERQRLPESIAYAVGRADGFDNFDPNAAPLPARRTF